MHTKIVGKVVNIQSNQNLKRILIQNFIFYIGPASLKCLMPILTTHYVLDWAVLPSRGRHCIAPGPVIFAKVTTVVRRIHQTVIWEICSIPAVCMWLLGVPTLTWFACGSHVNMALVLYTIYSLSKAPRTHWKDMFNRNDITTVTTLG